MTKPWNSFSNHFQKRKLRNSVPNHFWKRKHLKIRSKPFFGTENTRKMTTFVSCFVKLHYFCGIPFRSVRFRTPKLALTINTEFFWNEISMATLGEVTTSNVALCLLAIVSVCIYTAIFLNFYYFSVTVYVLCYVTAKL